MNYRIFCLVLSFSLVIALFCGCNSTEANTIDAMIDNSGDKLHTETTDRTTLDLTDSGEYESVPGTSAADEIAAQVTEGSVAMTTEGKAPQSSPIITADSIAVSSPVSTSPNTSAVPVATTTAAITTKPITQAVTTTLTTTKPPQIVISIDTTAQTTAPQTTAPTIETESPVVLPTSHELQFDASKSGIYNYCPSIMQIDANTAYIYYCTNKISRNVTDYIGCRKGTRNAEGKWDWGSEQIVLSPSLFRWDARHACDPSVVAGSFKYNGEQYSYLMAYLGCTSNDSQDNKIGLAVAKSPVGPFVKVGTSPFIDFEFDGSADKWEWGVGQPSIINIDKQSKIMMFYTRGDRNGTRTIVEEWDLSDLSSPTRHSQAILSTKGLKNLNGKQDIMNNADFVYDSVKGRYYAVSDCHPNPSSEPDYISSHFRINYFDVTSSYTSFTWKQLTTVGKSETQFARNHNTGVLRDAYGHLPDKYLSVFYTVSIEGSDCLWSYRIYDYYVSVPK